MTTLTVRTQVGGDGTLRLEVPCNLPPGPVEVVLVLQPSASASEPTPDRSPRHPARSGLFAGRGPVGLDPDSVIEEMDAGWKARLAGLEP